MAGVFEDEMRDRFAALIKGCPLSKIGQAEEFNFDNILRSLRIWEIVASRDAALFSLQSQNWSAAILKMLNDTHESVGSMAERRPIEHEIRAIVANLRPEFDKEWLAYTSAADLDGDFVEEANLPADFMGLCRERLIESKGYKIRGCFYDLFAVYSEGFLPCGWDGEFPNGTLLIY